MITVNSKRHITIDHGIRFVDSIHANQHITPVQESDCNEPVTVKQLLKDSQKMNNYTSIYSNNNLSTYISHLERYALVCSLKVKHTERASRPRIPKMEAVNEQQQQQQQQWMRH
ncbi:hypothetical protein F2P81_013185 [Scophthalmus maximus]|uniref:Uncharacterized protein n=1 Tax=Scophthalmus maximus TaxID=52904 RepID=A0A6A4SQ39_SCOMX|nr:hypothetical protein F2P81_013185 [Scophthalmus maximus]